MTITLCYSMQFAEKAESVKADLEKLEHAVHVSHVNHEYIGLNDEEKEKLKLQHKYEEDAIIEHYELIKQSDAILVLNYDKNEIKNYIGGNTFLEMGFAYVQNKKIYLLNPIPDMIYTTEIIAMKPIMIDRNIDQIK